MKNKTKNYFFAISVLFGIVSFFGVWGRFELYKERMLPFPVFKKLLFGFKAKLNISMDLCINFKTAYAPKI